MGKKLMVSRWIGKWIGRWIGRWMDAWVGWGPWGENTLGQCELLQFHLLSISGLCRPQPFLAGQACTHHTSQAGAMGHGEQGTHPGPSLSPPVLFLLQADPGPPGEPGSRGPRGVPGPEVSQSPSFCSTAPGPLAPGPARHCTSGLEVLHVAGPWVSVHYVVAPGVTHSTVLASHCHSSSTRVSPDPLETPASR
jgi:hypothetical protein